MYYPLNNIDIDIGIVPLHFLGKVPKLTCVRFTKNNKHVISIGGNDKAIFQFKVSFNEEGKEELDSLIVT